MVGASHAMYTDRFHELASRDGGSNGAKDYAEGSADFCKDMSGKDDNKRTKTVNVFATTVNPVGRENTGTWPKDCRGVPRNVNNAINPTVRACYECGSTDHVRGQGRETQGNQARGRAFMLGAEEAC
ncbi:hypothetical protein Tco_0841221 [Tanacetum coccineum]|uniref:Uncharacterized protein n=1 Tax=Tanacetum coccineum TaxID=301880 RepID=A0ABQ5B1E2_9ASTR